MLLNRRSLSLLGIGLLLAAGTVGIFMTQQSTSQVTFNRIFSVKFVCGVQPNITTPGEPPVKPANYATDINIHNYKNVTVSIRKRVIVLVNKDEVRREPIVTAPIGSESVNLPSKNATMDDCNKIAQLANIPLSNPQTLFIGFLQIESSADLNVTSVYTAKVPGATTAAPTGISQSVEIIPGKIP
jgi:hypothetical protein